MDFGFQALRGFKQGLDCFSIMGEGNPMGKKPVVALVGLVWAGMALVGCENCKNCRQKFNTTPTFAKNAGATPQGGPALPPAEGAVVNGGKIEQPAKQPEAPSIAGFRNEVPDTGAGPAIGPGQAAPAAAGTPVSSTNQLRSSMRPGEDLAPRRSEMPGRNDDLGRASDTIGSRLSSSRGMEMPPQPIIQPASAQGGRLPNLTSTPPPPTMPKEFLPGSEGRSLPPLGAEVNPSVPPPPASTNRIPPVPDMPGTTVPLSKVSSNSLQGQ
jgi:hypothetical protein